MEKKESQHSLKQKEEELAVFKSFLSVCEYRIEEGSIFQGDPPNPDILCVMENGISVAFELSNCVDERLARKMNDRTVAAGSQGDFIISEAVEDVIIAKNGKLAKGGYVSHAARFELLIYTGCMPIFPYWKEAIPYFFQKMRDEILFDRVWIFKDDRLDPSIFYRWDSERT